jgi:hypothetical protein
LLDNVCAFSVSEAVAIQWELSSALPDSDVGAQWVSVHTPLAQSFGTRQVLASAHFMLHAPPQSTLDSLPFSTPSEHELTAQR